MARPAKGGKRPTGPDTLLKIIDALTLFKSGEFTTNELMRKAEVSYATAYKYLFILQKNEWVEGYLDLAVHKVRGIHRWKRLKGSMSFSKPRDLKHLPTRKKGPRAPK